MMIGNLDLESKLLLAPMAEITDAPFRKIAKKHGAGLTFTQMVSAKGVVENNFQTLRHLSFSKEEKPIGVQILGNDPEWIYAAVNEIVKTKPNLIDLNCGCPMDKVTKFNMGAGLLQDPVHLERIVKTMTSASDGIPVSVKLRLGINRTKINILETAKAAEEGGASLVFIHTRAKTDKYRNEPMWEWLSKVKEVVSIPVVGNGSIFSHTDAADMINSTGCDSVLVARGALGNPFIFRDYNLHKTKGVSGEPIKIEEVYETAAEHISLLEKEYDIISGLHSAKKNIVWYYRKFNGISELLKNIFSINSYDVLNEFVADHTEKIKQDIFPEEDLDFIEEKFKNKVLFWLYNPNLYSMRVAG
jgi:tRNA-dihydrouridine synthase B